MNMRERSLVVRALDVYQAPFIDHQAHGSKDIMMPSYASGDLVWDPTEATAPRWVLLLDGPPGGPRRRVDSQDPATPQAASTSQLRELIRRAFHADTGHWPVSVTLAAVWYKQRFRFHVVMV
jgi:hypothetical protein